MLGSLARRIAPAVRGARAAASRSLSTAQPAVLPDLPYDYDELQPYISETIMKLHHAKHHNTYVTNYNAAMEKFLIAQSGGDVAGMVALQPAIRFNGGGHVNHSIFWTNLAPAGKGGGGAPEGELAEMIDAQFGSFDAFKAKMAAETAAVQGSGWGWLGFDAAADKLVIATCANQDPLSLTGLTPLLGIDIWEHAYYLDYKNVRPDYLAAIWNVVNWANVADRLADAKA